MEVNEEILPLASKDSAGYQNWIVDTMSLWLEDPAEKIDPEHPFVDCSLDSVAALKLLGMLEVLTGQPMDPALFSKYPTPALLAGHLSDLAEA
jgi:acyl carrier protein